MTKRSDRLLALLLALVLTPILVVSAAARWILGFIYPIDWWHGGIFGVFVLAIVLPFFPLERSNARILLASIFLAITAIGYGMTWGVRERFIRDVYQVEPGMPKSESRIRLQSYTRGPKYEISADQISKAAEEDCDQFRYNDSGPAEFDVGIVCYDTEGLVETRLFSSD